MTADSTITTRRAALLGSAGVLALAAPAAAAEVSTPEARPEAEVSAMVAGTPDAQLAELARELSQ